MVVYVSFPKLEFPREFWLLPDGCEAFHLISGNVIVWYGTTYTNDTLQLPLPIRIYPINPIERILKG